MTSSKKFNPFKDLQSDQIQKSSFKIFTARYACRNADLNLTVVMVMTNGFIFQIINSLIECWGVRLTCLDCKALDFDWFSPQPYSHQKTAKHIPYSFYNHMQVYWMTLAWNLCIRQVKAWFNISMRIHGHSALSPSKGGKGGGDDLIIIVF